MVHWPPQRSRREEAEDLELLRRAEAQSHQSGAATRSLDDALAYLAGLDSGSLWSDSSAPGERGTTSAQSNPASVQPNRPPTTQSER